MRPQQQNQDQLSFENIWLLFKETEKRFQETDRLLSEKFKETDKKIKDLAELFTGQWGKLVEALMTPGCLALFQQRGFELNQAHPNIESERNGRKMEIDLTLVNNKEIVIIEVKTTARIKYIKKLLKDLQEFKYFFPQYKNYKVYGAIAAIRHPSQTDKYAMKNGLFVIKSSGEGLVKIQNPTDFTPKCF